MTNTNPRLKRCEVCGQRIKPKAVTKAQKAAAVKRQQAYRQRKSR